MRQRASIHDIDAAKSRFRARLPAPASAAEERGAPRIDNQLARRKRLYRFSDPPVPCPPVSRWKEISERADAPAAGVRSTLQTRGLRRRKPRETRSRRRPSGWKG